MPRQPASDRSNRCAHRGSHRPSPGRAHRRARGSSSRHCAYTCSYWM